MMDDGGKSRGRNQILVLMAFLLVLGLWTGQTPWAETESSPAPAVQRVKIDVEDAGVYAVSYEDLAGATNLPAWIASASLGLTNRGRAVPLWVEDGGDGQFGPGDRIVFVAEALRGEYSFLDEYSRFNCYFLDFGSAEPTQGDATVAEKGGDPSSGLPLMVRQRFEEDLVMVRYPERPGFAEERWYWSRMSVMDREPMRVSVTLDHPGALPERVGADAATLRDLTMVGAEPGAVRRRLAEVFSGESADEGVLSVTIGLRGWSKPRRDKGMAHHAMTVTANGKPLEGFEWDGTKPYTHTVEMPLSEVKDDRVDFEFRVPRRTEPNSTNLFVDVQLFNFVEIAYDRDDRFGEGQSRFEPDPDKGPGTGHLVIDARRSGFLYGAGPTRVSVGQGTSSIDTGILGSSPYYAVLGEEYRQPDRIRPDYPSALRTTDRQADYIIITHHTLKDAVEPLAAFHRGRGLSVAVVDVEDVYDEFNDGIQHPRSVRDFLDWAYHKWEEPKPRFVLLAGDASWDYKNPTADDKRYADWTYRPGESKRFIKNSSSSYDEMATVNHRNLVPTWGYRTSQGHAASDNWLVSVDGDDIFPDLAVGRIPVTEPAEMAAVINKTIAYETSAPAGDWRKSVLFITNESRGFQAASDSTAEEYAARGYEITKIYPQPEEANNDAHSRAIVDAFDRGLLMVQFLGHGGRYIWRTGPPDLKKNHDLFTLDHLDMLAPNLKLPFVVSLTCYSAPFDHPTADSIGEKLLRLDGRGAIAVFAASWRNSPSSVMGRVVMDEVTRPGATIGEGLMRAKRLLRSPTLVETYNLLGDPAIVLDLANDVLPVVQDDDETSGSAETVSRDAGR